MQAALEQVQYKLIDNGDEPHSADVPELDGVWATGHTVEDAGILLKLSKSGSQLSCIGGCPSHR